MISPPEGSWKAAGAAAQFLHLGVKIRQSNAGGPRRSLALGLVLQRRQLGETGQFSDKIAADTLRGKV